MRTIRKTLSAAVVAGGVLLAPVLTAPASATVLATDTVLLNDVEAHFGIVFDPTTWNAVGPALVQWDYNAGNQHWTPRLDGVLLVEGMAPGDCAKVVVDYYDGTTWLGFRSDSLCSATFGVQSEGVSLTSFSSPVVDKVVISLDLLTGAGWDRAESKTRLLN